MGTIAGFGPARLGTIDLDWVYNFIPPLEPVGEF
jgi:hypothetical protein